MEDPKDGINGNSKVPRERIEAIDRTFAGQLLLRRLERQKQDRTDRLVDMLEMEESDNGSEDGP